MINIYHLFANRSIQYVLVDTKCKNYLDRTLAHLSNLDCSRTPVDHLHKDYLRKRDLQENLGDLLLDSDLKSRYDILFVSKENIAHFLPIMHRAVYIFVQGTESSDVDPLKSHIGFDPYKLIRNFIGGVLYENEFHSIIFAQIKLTLEQQLYVRDKPYRFLRKMQRFAMKTECETIVEIGSSRAPLQHDLSILNAECCNDSHSTYFWCELPVTVTTIDVNPSCKRILKAAQENDSLSKVAKLEIVESDGIAFFNSYDGAAIDILFLDAWDVVPDTDYAEKHLECYEAAKKHLNSQRCFIIIDDTDICSGGKGRLLIPVLICEGWTILYQGRHTVFYKSSAVA